jgi:hypothetical protein
MYRGTLAMVGTALAAGVLVSAPVAVAMHGADDPPAQVAADDGTARAPASSAAPSAGDHSALSRGGGNRTAVRVAGTCTDGSRAKLKLKPDDGRVEVEFEVDENRNGSRWGVAMSRNGSRVLSRSAVTRGPSGSFSVEARIAPGSPRTTVTAVGRRAATGEVCRATATL